QSALGVSVVGLVAGNGSQGAAVVFEIEFAVPYREAGGLGLHALAEPIEEGNDALELDLGRARNPPGQALAALDHGAGRPAAAIAIAVADQDFVVDGLGLVALPGAHHFADREVGIVGGEDGFALEALCGDELGLG